MTPPPSPQGDPVPFLWLMDISSSIIEHTVQASWGVSALMVVAKFLHDPANCTMGALLPWASAYGSPARFHLHHATLARSPSTPATSPLALLAADYGMKARSASGLRADEVDDWPCLSVPEDLTLLQTHISLLAALPHLGSDAHALLSGGLPSADPLDTPSFRAKEALLALGDPRLPYSLFEPHAPLQDGHAGMLPLRFVGDPRIPKARDHPWTDLLLIGSDPNFALLDPTRGLSPITVPNPPRMPERIRWALHSLCQATLEAVAAPLPRLCRPPRPLIPTPAPPPMNSPSMDPARASDPPPPPPPPKQLVDRSTLPPLPPGHPSRAEDTRTTPPPPLHSGVPPASSWARRPVPATYGTLWSSLHCGPNHVALAGFTTPLTPNLRVGALNTNGLTATKLTELLWYMRLEQLDVFFLLDTRAPQRAGKFLGRQARSFLGPGSVALVSPARSAHAKAPLNRQSLVGGQLLLIGPRWGCALKSSRKDPTGLGVLTEAVLGCAGGDILLLGTYFPCPPTSGLDPSAPSNKLWDMLQQWLHQHEIPDSPAQYLKDLVTLKTLRHCGRSTANTAPIAIVGGDFNATWSDHQGPLKALGGWASTTWVQEQGRRNARRSTGRRHFDGWSPAAMALKAKLAALTMIHGHLHTQSGTPRHEWTVLSPESSPPGKTPSAT